MSTLRDEIAALRNPYDPCDRQFDGWFQAKHDVLAIIDKPEAENAPCKIAPGYCETHLENEGQCPLPSDERPARDDRRALYECLRAESGNKPIFYGILQALAIVEAIDANTEAQAAKYFHLLAAINALTAAVKSGKQC